MQDELGGKGAPPVEFENCQLNHVLSWVTQNVAFPLVTVTPTAKLLLLGRPARVNPYAPGKFWPALLILWVSTAFSVPCG